MTNLNTENSTGPTEDKLTGLNIEERKRRRSGPGGSEIMDTDRSFGSFFPEAVLSNADCAYSSLEFSIMFAKQAIQSNESPHLKLSKVGEPSHSSCFW